MKLFRTKKRDRTKSENDLSKRSSVDHDEKKKLSATSSNFVFASNSNENTDVHPTKSSVNYHHHLSVERVSNSNPLVNRRYSNPFFTSARQAGPRTSLAVVPSYAQIPQQRSSQPLKPSIQLSRSVDRLTQKAQRRELRYEEHDDYKPSPLYAIRCQPTDDQYAKNLNQDFKAVPSFDHRSQIDNNSRETNRRLSLPRSYPKNLTLPQSQTFGNFQSMSTANQDENQNHPYGKLSDCYTPEARSETSLIKPPRRVETNYGQFPTSIPITQEPIYANTQSLYDNILYPQTSSMPTARTPQTNLTLKNDQKKRSCASQTQLTWTMATFSSFVDLENPSIIIPQPDPTTLFSIVQHHQPEPPPSASPETIEQYKRFTSATHYGSDDNMTSHYQRPRTPQSTNSLMIEKRDGSFQTLLSLAPNQSLETNRNILMSDSTVSPHSFVTSPIEAEHHGHRHHRHRKHRSKTHHTGSHVSTRDVGLQVNIQTVKKITFLNQKSEDSSVLTSPTSPPVVKKPVEYRTVETNTEPVPTKCDQSTACGTDFTFVTSLSEMVESPTTSEIEKQTKEAQKITKNYRNQSIETEKRGLFVCDLSSLLNNDDDQSPSLPIRKENS